MSVRPYKRAVRVASELFHVISETLRCELTDPRLDGVQLTGSKLTDDLQIMKIYYYIDGSDEKRKKCLDGLHSAKGYLKRAISEQLSLRLIPEIQYHFDETIERAEKLDKLIDGLNIKEDPDSDQMGEN